MQEGIKPKPSRKTALVIAGGISALVGAALVSPHCNRNTYTATVAEKERKKDVDMDWHLVHAKLPDGKDKVFETDDSLLEWRFDANKAWAKIEAGKTYEFKTYGWSIPFIPSYENIVCAKELKK